MGMEITTVNPAPYRAVEPVSVQTRYALMHLWRDHQTCMERGHSDFAYHLDAAACLAAAILVLRNYAR